ncbi:Mitochondrial intermediate peptidase protein, partial [Thalictrum thalictroides]
GDLGYLYLDLHSRKGKYPGCVHFAIKGGWRISATEYQLPQGVVDYNWGRNFDSITEPCNGDMDSQRASWTAKELHGLIYG